MEEQCLQIHLSRSIQICLLSTVGSWWQYNSVQMMIHHFIDIHSAVLVLLFCYGSIIPIEIGVKLRPLSTLESFICIPSGSPPLVIYISKAAVAAIRRCGPELHRKNHCLTIDILLLLPLMQRINFPARSIAWWSQFFVRRRLWWSPAANDQILSFFIVRPPAIANTRFEFYIELMFGVCIYKLIMIPSA